MINLWWWAISESAAVIAECCSTSSGSTNGARGLACIFGDGLLRGDRRPKCARCAPAGGEAKTGTRGQKGRGKTGATHRGNRVSGRAGFQRKRVALTGKRAIGHDR